MAKRRGKYAAITDKLPRMPLVDPTRMDVVTAVTTQILAPRTLEETQPESPGLSIPDLLDTADRCLKEINELAIRSTAGRKWASEYARTYAELRAIREKVATWDTMLSVTLEAYLALMVPQMEAEGVTSIRLASGQSVSWYYEPYLTVTNKEDFRQWCIKQGLERSLHLNWQTANNLVKQMLIRGDEEPPGTATWSKVKVRLGEGDL